MPIRGRLPEEIIMQPTVRAFAVTSDGKTGTAIAVDGFSAVAMYFNAGIQTAGDSADTLTLQAEFLATSSESTDAGWASFAEAVVDSATGAASDGLATSYVMDLDLVEYGMTTGWVRATITPSVGMTIPCSADVILYKPNRGGAMDDEWEQTVIYADT